MKLAVWEYKIPYEDFPVISLPARSRPLSVGVQGNDELVVWVAVDTEALDELVAVPFRVAGTGHPLGDQLNTWFDGTGPLKRFLGTVQDSRGLVWHVWAV